MTATHLHLVLNHLPLFGLLAAMIPLGVGLARGTRELLLVGLLMGALFGAVTPVVVFTGEEAEESLEEFLDSDSLAWLETHEERAEVAAPVVYAAAILCLLGLAALVKDRTPRLQRPVGGVCALGLCLSLAALGWVGQAGGQIRHPELRGGADGADPIAGQAAAAVHDHHHDDLDDD
jgi:hypothetical protein